MGGGILYVESVLAFKTLNAFFSKPLFESPCSLPFKNYVTDSFQTFGTHFLHIKYLPLMFSFRIFVYFKGVGLKEQKLAKFGTVSFLACKIRSFQNDNAIFVNQQEITFFGAQKGLWGGRGGSIFLIFRKKRVKYFKKINLSRVRDRWQQTTKSGKCVGGKFALFTILTGCENSTVTLHRLYLHYVALAAATYFRGTLLSNNFIKSRK